MTRPLTQETTIIPGSTPAEAIPSKAGEISAVASACAPFVIFDSAIMLAAKEGLGIVTLTCDRPIAANEHGEVVLDRVVTCNLRGTIPALLKLRGAIDMILNFDPPAPAGSEGSQREEPIDLAGAAVASNLKN